MDSNTEDIGLKELRKDLTVKRLMELISMLILYISFDTSGIKKYVVALLFCSVFFLLGRKKKWDLELVLCVGFPIIIYILCGSFSTFISGMAQITTIKIVLYWVMPFLLAFSIYTCYGADMNKIMDSEFFGCLLAYALFDAPNWIKIFRWESIFAFSFGIFAMYYAYNHRWKSFVVALLFLVFAEKRIAIVAVVLALLTMGIQWLFRYNRKLLYVIWGGCIAATFLYVFLIHSGILEAVCWGANINTNGRVEIYGRMADEASFSVTYLGKGIGYVEHLLQCWKISTFSNLHNDLLKFYIELGFLGLLLYLLAYGVVIEHAGKKYSDSKAACLLGMLVYTMLLFSTDNVSIYMVYLVPLYSAFFAVLASEKSR